MSKPKNYILDREVDMELQLWQPEVVECSINVAGECIHIDHAYELFAAISSKQVILHDPNLKIGIFGINGIPDRQNRAILHLTDKSRLRLRLPIQAVGIAFRLEGQSLIIGSHEIQLGEASINRLNPSPRLTSRLIVIKDATEPDLFLSACQRQMEKLKIEGEIKVENRSDGRPKYRTIKVRWAKIIGFGLTVTNLNPIDSLILQQEGLGGKRKMGCGMFVPVHGRNNDGTQNDTPA
jgi:CRISPR-associated protein Cas6